MRIYKSKGKKLQYRKSSRGGREFYLDRHGVVYKLHGINSAIDHISRNLKGVRKIAVIIYAVIIAKIFK